MLEVYQTSTQVLNVENSRCNSLMKPFFLDRELLHEFPGQHGRRVVRHSSHQRPEQDRLRAGLARADERHHFSGKGKCEFITFYCPLTMGIGPSLNQTGNFVLFRFIFSHIYCLPDVKNARLLSRSFRKQRYQLIPARLATS